MNLDGTSVLLTGATGGLGRAIGAALASRGATVILNSRKEAELHQLAASLPGHGHRVTVSDLADDGSALALVEAAGDVDVLVANAALPGTGRLEEYSHAEIDRVLRINLDSPIRMARELLPQFLKRGSGQLVFVSSLSGKISAPRSSLYAATKFGLRGFAFCLRDDLRGTGIGVSVVSPGFIRGAGMFADSGAPPPPGLGTATPKEVGAAVIKAVERNLREVTVAPARQRLGAWLAVNAPELCGRLVGSTASRAADRIAAGQKGKR